MLPVSREADSDAVSACLWTAATGWGDGPNVPLGSKLPATELLAEGLLPKTVASAMPLLDVLGGGTSAGGPGGDSAGGGGAWLGGGTFGACCISSERHGTGSGHCGGSCWFPSPGCALPWPGGSTGVVAGGPLGAGAGDGGGGGSTGGGGGGGAVAGGSLIAGWVAAVTT